MGRQAKVSTKELMGQVYREFSRQKYQKYKAQHPNMRETQIVSKIIQEWDALDGIARNELKTLYQKKKYLTLEDISSSEALQKSRLNTEKQQGSAKKRLSAVLDTTAHRSSGSVPQKKRSDSSVQKGSSRKDESVERASESSAVAGLRKTKKIVHQRTDYITFFKRKHSELSREHPRWNAAQISSIIKLEWKRFKEQSKQYIKRVGRRRPTRLVSGYKYFRNVRRFTREDAVKVWRRFPKETKICWRDRAEDVQREPLNSIVSQVIFKNEPETAQEFRFLNYRIS